ncbi:MAG: hypothetical protein J0I07_40265, partial [Myxococcales bacterium]|nr:hypothetical protein [Myxococcales bacterium]
MTTVTGSDPFFFRGQALHSDTGSEASKDAEDGHGGELCAARHREIVPKASGADEYGRAQEDMAGERHRSPERSANVEPGHRTLSSIVESFGGCPKDTEVGFGAWGERRDRSERKLERTEAQIPGRPDELGASRRKRPLS